MLIRAIQGDNRFVASGRAVRMLRINAEIELGRRRGEDVSDLVAKRSAMLDDAVNDQLSDAGLDRLLRAVA